MISYFWDFFEALAVLIPLLLCPGTVCLHAYYSGELKSGYQYNGFGNELKQIFLLSGAVFAVTHVGFWLTQKSTILLGIDVGVADGDVIASFVWLNSVAMDKAAIDGILFSRSFFTYWNVLLVASVIGIGSQVLVLKLELDRRFPKLFKFRNRDYDRITGRWLFPELKDNERIAIVVEDKTHCGNSFEDVRVGLLNRCYADARSGFRKELEVNELKEIKTFPSKGKLFPPLITTKEICTWRVNDLDDLVFHYYAVNRRTGAYRFLCRRRSS